MLLRRYINAATRNRITAHTYIKLVGYNSLFFCLCVGNGIHPVLIQERYSIKLKNGCRVTVVTQRITIVGVLPTYGKYATIEYLPT